MKVMDRYYFVVSTFNNYLLYLNRRYLIKKPNLNNHNDEVRNCETSTDKPVSTHVSPGTSTACNLENNSTNISSASDEAETVETQQQVKHKKRYKRKFREEHMKKFRKWLGTNEKKETMSSVQ